MFAKIPLDENNRMLRFGFGKHDGNWFVRADLWFTGFRLSCQKSLTPPKRLRLPNEMETQYMSDVPQSGVTRLLLDDTGQEFK
jgi:hypothetical protein